MEKEALIEALKEKVGENDFSVLSAQSIDALVTPLLPSFADDEKITDDSWILPVSMLKNFAGQYRHDLAAGSEAEKVRLAKENEAVVKNLANKEFEKFKAEYEEKHGQKPDGKNNGGDEGQGENAVTKALNEYNIKLFGPDGKSGLIGGQLNATSEFIKASQKAAEAEKISSIKQQLKSYLSDDRGASREPIINLAIGDLEISASSNIDELKLNVEKIYEARYKEFYGDSGKPFGGNSAGGIDDGEPDEDVAKYIEGKALADKAKAEKMAAVRKTFV